MRLVMIVVIFIFSLYFIPNDASAETLEEIELANGEVVEVLFEDRSNGYKYEVRFANGREYFWEQSGNTGRGGGSMALTDEEMDLAQQAIDEYEQIYGDPTTSNNQSSGNPVGIIFILGGLFSAFFPHAAWYLQIGWKLKDTDPSELALIANRVGGGIVAIIGLFTLF
ncbi:DUF6199 family natural product biosynthesis protein [Texcoconibacillus texcoconensis]|uniref:DUF6199 domain-containing protein n=1 Tax=Texcoconibacillus texcoconensis TaxID=1095777 RepID=A0A840QH21_9BACI|nr:DUF6199 family natural product biosynthesis protein [Texcoconibacillus texcoconensis]MBB5171952.1 hypothetical protein [Texcoconibacillus texcoconensis]